MPLTCGQTLTITTFLSGEDTKKQVDSPLSKNQPLISYHYNYMYYYKYTMTSKEIHMNRIHYQEMCSNTYNLFL